MTYARFDTPEFLYGDSARLYGIGSSDSNLHWIVEIDWDGDGEFDGTNESEFMTDIITRRGRDYYIRFSQDGTANGFEEFRIGYLRIKLDNSNGRFDPYNTASDLYPNVLAGRLIRVRVQYLAEIYPIFLGKITDINLVREGMECLIGAEDGGRALHKADSSESVQVNISVSDAIDLLLTDANWTASRNIESTADDIPYWWANDKVITEISRLASAELGTFFISREGSATYYSRHHSSAPTLTLTEADVLRDIDVPQPQEVVRNVIRVIAHPLIQGATAALWTLSDKPVIKAGLSLNSGNGVWASYRSNEVDVSAINVITPVATTDFLVNTAIDGSGSDLTSQCTVTTFTDFGKTSKIVIKNNSGSDGYLIFLQVRGDPLEAPDSSIVVVEDETSQALYDKAQFTLDTPWLQSTSLANDFALWMNSFLPTPQRFVTIQIEARPELQFDTEIFDVIDFSSAKKNIDGNFHIGYIEHECLTENCQAVRTTLKLEPFPDMSGYWIFDKVTGNVQIGINTIFGL